MGSNPTLGTSCFNNLFACPRLSSLSSAHYVEKVRDSKTIQTFLAGVDAAVVGGIAVVSLELIPEALVRWPAMVISIISFLLIVWVKRNVALVAVGAMAGGIIYSALRALA